ncbi:hypothetical protein [Rhizobium sp. CFBP 13726]|uniref:hypothetical protein n=1 Tax=Rhizobium sp. CFBP 13726 TaxID=2775296 RepID=UPI001A927BB2|nr:hypothetical protein [Rhizobium sp. CFBP 13726]
MTPSLAAHSRRSAFPVRFGFAFQLGHGSKMVGERSPQFFLLMPCDKFDRCPADSFDFHVLHLFHPVLAGKRTHHLEVRSLKNQG